VMRKNGANSIIPGNRINAKQIPHNALISGLF
jgi:hypothetical protein